MVAILVLVAILGAVCVRVLNRTLDDLSSAAGAPTEASLRTLRTLFGSFTAMMAVTLIGIGSYLAYFSAGVLRSSRFPPAGLRVIKDTRVITGKGARMRGAVGIGLAVLLILTGLAFPVLAWRVSSLLTGRA